MRPVDNPFFVSLFDDLLIPDEAAPKDASSDTPTYLDYDFKSNKGENSIWGKTDRKLPSKAPFPHNTDVPTFAEGGIMSPDETYLAEQEDGELEEVPPGATAEGVKDDIDIKISEGEIVVPEDVARWHGLKWFMEARNEAKEGLAQMQSEGLIKAPQGAMPASAMGLPGKPSMPLLDTTEAPEMGFADGGTAGDDDGGDGKGGSDDGGAKGDGSDAMGGMNDGFGNVEGANTTDGYTDSSGASTLGYDSPSTNVSTSAMSEDEEDSGKPAATVGFAPPDETVQAVSRSFDSARNNVTAMGTGLAGAMGNLAGGRATAQVDPETGLYGTSFSNNPAQALGTIAGMATGISGLGKAAGWGADQMGIGQNNLGFDATNNGLVGAIGAGVDGFGYAGEGVDNTTNGEDTMTAMQSLVRRPY